MKNKSESVLDNLVIAAPCSIPWESMKGDERQRDCSGCAKTVYNISDMTKAEAERFLKDRGATECMRFYRRTDGTIMTDNCPRALRRIRDQYRFAARAVASVVALLLSAPAALAQSQPQMLLGKPARPHNITTQQSTAVRSDMTPPALAGGAMMIAPGEPALLNQPVKSTKPVVRTIRATLLTREQTLPDGRRVTLVVPNSDGRVIWTTDDRLTVSPNDFSSNDRTPPPRIQPPSINDKVERDAHQFFIKGQDMRHQGNLALSEFYFEKALSSFDLQKNRSDTKFRSIIEAELKSLRDQIEIQSGTGKLVGEEPGSSAVPAELP